MKERKLRIAEFIETLETDQMLLTSTTLVGAGEKLPPNDNIGNCINGDTGCPGSTNTGTCQNYIDQCKGSHNRRACNNAFDPSLPDKPVTNHVATSCK